MLDRLLRSLTPGLHARFFQPTGVQTVWCGVFAAWASALLAWVFPFWHWHHHPLQEVAVHFATYILPAFALTYLGLGFLQHARWHKQESKNIGYIQRLDHLRFFAASLVILYHFYHTYVPLGAASENPLLNLCSEGSSGVDLFFVLSGFIFALIAHGNRIRYWDYLFSRVVRIYPLYIFGLLVVTAAYRSNFNSGDVALLLLPIFDVGRLPTLPGFGQLWTIGLEFQFYLIFPFLAAFVLRHGPKYLLGLLVLVIGLRWFYFTHLGSVRELSQWSLVGRLDEFIAGMLASWVYATRRTALANPVHLVLAVAAVLGGMQGLVTWGGYFHGEKSAWWVFWPTIEGAFWAYLTLSYLSCRWRVPSVIDETLSGLGQLSFSLYVMHSFAMYWTQRNVGVLPLTGSHEWDVVLTGLGVCVPLAVVISLFTFNLIEKQFFVFRRRYVVPAVPAAVPVAA